MFVKTFFSVAASIIMLGAQVQGATIPESTDNTDVFVPPRVGIAVNPGKYSSRFVLEECQKFDMLTHSALFA